VLDTLGLGKARYTATAERFAPALSQVVQCAMIDDRREPSENATAAISSRAFGADDAVHIRGGQTLRLRIAGQGDGHMRDSRRR
jgi:hypothetical protein